MKPATLALLLLASCVDSHSIPVEFIHHANKTCDPVGGLDSLVIQSGIRTEECIDVTVVCVGGLKLNANTCGSWSKLPGVMQ